MELGIGLKPDGTPLTTVELVKLAEKNGLSHAWIVDSQLLCSDVYVNLALAALATKRIKLCTGVTNPYTRHPTVTANAIVTINEISQGRAVLGLGAGFSSAIPLGITPTLEECRKMIHALARLFRGEYATFDGKRVKLGHLEKEAGIPIYLAASRPKMLELAGELANGVIISAGADPLLIRRAIDCVRAGSEKAGRDFSELDIVCNIGCSISEDGLKAKDEARTFAARRAMDMIDRLPKEAAHMKRNATRIASEYDLSQHLSVGAKHARFVTDEMVEKFTLSGTPQEVMSKAIRIKNLGVKEISAFLVTKRRSKVIEYLGMIRRNVG